MSETFRTRLRRGETLLGPMVTLRSPSVSEILAEIGFDWLFLDGEHGPLETADLLAILQTVAARTACLVRVPSADETSIKRVLDLGATGIIAPQVNTADQAEQVVRWSRYAPEGARGVGIARAHHYGLRFGEYVESANQQVTVVVQAEHIEAVENIDEIVKVEGIDAVLIGPYDLSASLGKMGQLTDPEVVKAIERVTSSCLHAGVALGIFGITVESLRPYIEKGYTLITTSVDTILFANAAKHFLSELR